MTMTVEVGYDEVAEQKLQELRDDVESNTELQKTSIVTG